MATASSATGPARKARRCKFRLRNDLIWSRKAMVFADSSLQSASKHDRSSIVLEFQVSISYDHRLCDDGIVPPGTHQGWRGGRMGVETHTPEFRRIAVDGSLCYHAGGVARSSNACFSRSEPPLYR
jgi:hypothetical protein